MFTWITITNGSQIYECRTDGRRKVRRGEKVGGCRGSEKLVGTCWYAAGEASEDGIHFGEWDGP